MPRLRPIALAALLFACGCGKVTPPAPHQIRIVGGAAGFTASAAIAEGFMRTNPDAVAPLVRAGGDDAGIADFCGGIGARHPDLALVSRPPTAVEARRCAAGRVGRVAAVPIGWTATVLAARRPAPFPTIGADALDAAIAGPAPRWADVAPGLPDAPILIDGILDPHARRDGAYRPHGFDAALAADAAAQRAGGLARLPFAAWWRRRDTLAAIALDGVAPDLDAIASGRYPGRRPLLLLVKADAVRATPGLAALLHGAADALASGRGLADSGIVPLDPAGRHSAACALAAAAGDRPSYCNN